MNAIVIPLPSRAAQPPRGIPAQSATVVSLKARRCLREQTEHSHAFALEMLWLALEKVKHSNTTSSKRIAALLQQTQNTIRRINP